MQSYSFQDVNATVIGPGGTAVLGYGSGSAEEGIQTDMLEEKGRMMIGADGKVVHSLHASTAGRFVVRLLKTSPVNNILQNMYNLQASSSLLWGTNSIAMTNAATGDSFTGSAAAFVKQAPNQQAKEANIIEWEFNVGHTHQQLGGNLASTAANVFNG